MTRTTAISENESDAVAFDRVTARRAGRTVWTEGTFVVPRGAAVAVIGPNGSGKSTLLRLALGLLRPAAGRIAVLGGSPRRGDRRIGYVPQRGTEQGDMIRCYDLVAMGVTGARWGLRSLRSGERSEIAAMIDAVGATDHATDRLARLSGGQQQRIAIAQALVGQPELLLLDEPLTNLDLRNQQDIVALVGRLQTQLGFTVLLVTHDLNPVLSLVDSAIYFIDGHPQYDEINNVVDVNLLTRLYGTPMQVVRTAEGALFTRGA
jgi:zinc/manganese transport system ATP-binding protein